MVKILLDEKDFTIGDDHFAHVIQTEHEDGTVVTTAVHRQNFERRIGGMRFVELPEGKSARDFGLDEVGHLSSAMTYKCAAAGISADGQKTVAVTSSREVLDNHGAKVAILEEHIREVVARDPGVIFGPDMRVGEPEQDALSRKDGLLDHITGLSEGRGGLSIDKYGYTAEGVAQSVEAAYGRAGLLGRTITIQGFGAVGAHTARLLFARGAVLRAVSNERGVLVAEEAPGLDIPALVELWMNDDKGCLRSYAQRHPERARFIADPDALLDERTEIFVPAARTDVLAMLDEIPGIQAKENPNVRDAAWFWRRTGVRLVAEGANHPLSDAAEEFLEHRGVLVLPDFIVNCGGLIGCWVEWESRHRNRDARKLDDETADRARSWIRRVVAENVPAILAENPPLRQAAKALAKGKSSAYLPADLIAPA